MKYLYSNGNFYPLDLKDLYVEAGTWPEEGVEVDDDIFSVYAGEPPKDKMRGTSEKGLPEWRDLNQEELSAADDRLKMMNVSKKQSLLNVARDKISPLQDAVDLNVATDAEQASLFQWKKYRIDLNRVDAETSSAVEWPEAPSS